MKLPRSSSAIWVLAGTIGAAALSFLFQTVMSLVLADDAFGLLATAMVIAVAVSVILSAGVQNVLLDHVKSQNQSAADGLGAFARLWGYHTVVVGAAFVIAWLIVPDRVSELAFITTLAVMLTLFTILGASRQSVDDFQKVGLWLVAPELAKTAALLALLLLGIKGLGPSYGTFAVVFFCVALIIAVLCLPWRQSANGPAYVIIVKKGFPYALASMMFMIYYRSPLIVLAAFGLLAEAGSLAIIYLFITAALLLPTAYSQKFLLGRWHAIPKDDPNQFQTELKQQLLKVTAFSAPIALFAWVFADDLLAAVYGTRYDLAQQYAPWFTIIFFLRSLSIPLQTAASVDDLKWRKTLCICSAAGFALVGALVMAPTMGLLGAYLAGLIAELVLACSLTWVTWQRGRSA